VFRVHQLTGLSTGTALVLAGLVVTGLVVLVLARTAGASARALALAAVLVAVFAIQDQAAWHQLYRTASTFRATLPKDLEWVDHNSTGDVALLGITANAAQFDDLDFFNRSITQTYVPPSGLPGRAVQGHECTYELDQQGVLHLGTGCGPTPHRFLINDPSGRVTFYDEVRRASDPKIGSVIELPPGRPIRMRSLVVLPCTRPSPIYFQTKPDIVPATASMQCRPSLTGAVWIAHRGTIEVTYRGGVKQHLVTVGTKQYAVPPGREATVSVPVPAGYSQFSVAHDWSVSGGTPRVVSVDLVENGQRTPLL
jgi:hypothetical protein